MGRLGRILWKVRLEQGPERQVRLTSRRWNECERRLPALFCMLFWHTGVVAHYPNFKGLSACKVNKRNCHIPEIKIQTLPSKFQDPQVPILPPSPTWVPSLPSPHCSHAVCSKLIQLPGPLLMFSLCLEEKEQDLCPTYNFILSA